MRLGNYWPCNPYHRQYIIWKHYHNNIVGLVQDCSNSRVLAIWLMQSCIKQHTMSKIIKNKYFLTNTSIPRKDPFLTLNASKINFEQIYPKNDIYVLIQIRYIMTWCGIFKMTLHTAQNDKVTTHSWISTHWGRVTLICVGKQLAIIGSNNGFSPGRHQAIIWTNAGILLIGTLGTNFSEVFIKIHTFPFKKMHLKMLYGNWWPFCLSLNVLKTLPVL